MTEEGEYLTATPGTRSSGRFARQNDGADPRWSAATYPDPLNKRDSSSIETSDIDALLAQSHSQRKPEHSERAVENRDCLKTRNHAWRPDEGRPDATRGTTTRIT